MSQKREQSVPLLSEEEDAPEISRRNTRQRWRVLQIILSCYSLMTTCVLLYQVLQAHHESLPYSPANTAIQFQHQPVKLGAHTVFSTTPSDELHSAWSEMLTPTYVYATEEEIVRSGDDPHTSVRLAGGEYVALLGVYHQFHCLRWLYYLTHEELYWSNHTGHQKDLRRGHGRHCIQVLLDYIKCKPDTALYTVAFNASTGELPSLKSQSSWQCVNWNSVEDWVKSRSVGLDAGLVVPESFFDNV